MTTVQFSAKKTSLDVIIDDHQMSVWGEVDLPLLSAFLRGIAADQFEKFQVGTHWYTLQLQKRNPQLRYELMSWQQMQVDPHSVCLDIRGSLIFPGDLVEVTVTSKPDVHWCAEVVSPDDVVDLYLQTRLEYPGTLSVADSCSLAEVGRREDTRIECIGTQVCGVREDVLIRWEQQYPDWIEETVT